MREFKGTPGPWGLQENWKDIKTLPANATRKESSYKYSNIYGSNGRIIGEVKSFMDTFGYETLEVYEANVLLVSAAPLLLSALKSALEHIEEIAATFAITATVPFPFPKWYYEAKVAIEAAVSQPQSVVL